MQPAQHQRALTLAPALRHGQKENDLARLRQLDPSEPQPIAVSPIAQHAGALSPFVALAHAWLSHWRNRIVHHSAPLSFRRAMILPTINCSELAPRNGSSEP